MYTTSSFNTSLVESIINFMVDNNVKRLPLAFLACGEHGFPETSAIAKRFMESGHWEYFFIENGVLNLHVNYHGEYGLTEYDYEVLTDRVPTFEEKRKTSIQTLDLVNLVRVVYDTIGNVNFIKG